MLKEKHAVFLQKHFVLTFLLHELFPFTLWYLHFHFYYCSFLNHKHNTFTQGKGGKL